MTPPPTPPQPTVTGGDGDQPASPPVAPVPVKKRNGKRISGAIDIASKDYIINYQDLQGIGMTSTLAVSTLIAICSIALGNTDTGTYEREISYVMEDCSPYEKRVLFEMLNSMKVTIRQNRTLIINEVKTSIKAF